MQFDGVTELEMTKVGEVITLRPVRQNWLSLMDLPLADDDFLIERSNVVTNR